MADGHSITRRELVGAATGAALAAPAVTAIFDPALDLVQRYRAGMKAFNEAPDAPNKAVEERLIAATYGPPYEEMLFRFPVPTTRQGAIETAKLLTYEQEQQMTDDAQVNMARALLNYLERA